MCSVIRSDDARRRSSCLDLGNNTLTSAGMLSILEQRKESCLNDINGSPTKIYFPSPYAMNQVLNHHHNNHHQQQHEEVVLVTNNPSPCKHHQQPHSQTSPMNHLQNSQNQGISLRILTDPSDPNTISCQSSGQQQQTGVTFERLSMDHHTYDIPFPPKWVWKLSQTLRLKIEPHTLETGLQAVAVTHHFALHFASLVTHMTLHLNSSQFTTSTCRVLFAVHLYSKHTGRVETISWLLLYFLWKLISLLDFGRDKCLFHPECLLNLCRWCYSFANSSLKHLSFVYLNCSTYMAWLEREFNYELVINMSWDHDTSLFRWHCHYLKVQGTQISWCTGDTLMKG